MAPHSCDRLGERPEAEEVAEQLVTVEAELIHRSTLVAAVEGPQEVAPVAAVEHEQLGPLRQEPRHDSGALGPLEMARGEPRVTLDDVGGDERVLEVERGAAGLIGEDGPEGALFAARHGPFGAWGGSNPGVLDDRVQMDVLDVMAPVDDRRVEAEGRLVGDSQTLEQPQGPVDPKARLGLAVGAVELDIAERPHGVRSSLLETGAGFGPLTSEGERVHESLSRAQATGRPPQLALDPTPAGEGPAWDDDRLPTVVVERPFGEPPPDEVDELAVMERISDSGRDLVDGRAARVRSTGRDGDESRHDEVDRYYVHDALGHARELAKEASCVRDDHRLGHPEATDPSGARLGERGLHDRRADEGHRELAAHVEQSVLAERLREGIGVRPPERLRPGAPERHHPIANPVASELFGLLSQERRAGRTELGPSGPVEACQPLGTSAGCVLVLASAPGCSHFGLPVELRHEPGGRDQLFGGVALVTAVHIRRRDRDEVGECLAGSLGDGALGRELLQCRGDP